MFIKGSLFYIFLLSICSIVFLYTKSILLFVLIILLILFVLIKVDYKMGLFLCAIFIFFMFYKVNNKPSIQQSNIDIYAKVIEVKEKYIIIKSDDIRYLVYINEDIEIFKNDSIHIVGKVSEIEKDLDIDVFEFATYINNKRVFYSIDIDKLEICNSNKLLSERIIDFCCNKLTNESYSMSKMLLFNDSKVDIDSYESLKKINAIHLFVVSGFHISFLYSLIERIFNKNKLLSLIIGLSICIFYVFILDFSISATRAVLSLIAIKLVPKQFNSLDGLSLSGIIMLLIEPLNVYSYSFILSYLITFVIIVTRKLYCKHNKIIQSLIVSLISFIATIPIQLILNYQINVISLLTNFLLSYVVSIIFVLCIIGLPMSLIHGNIFGFIYNIFNKGISFISEINTTILFGRMPNWLVIIYYLVFFAILYFIENKRKLNISVSVFLLCSIMLALYFQNYFNPFQRVTFLNVYQGDCTIIIDSYSEKVMLIDTGGQLKYDIATKKIIPYLKYHGINRIDIVVITHDDFDHNGALESLNNNIIIDNIISDNNIDSVKLGKITLENLNCFDNKSGDKNDNSIVLYGNIGGFNYLFTGDISKSVEKKIIDNYNSLDVDVLKVAHHGSKSSTSDEFVSFITPNYAIISVGYNNIYKHPNQEVINVLEKYNVIIYRTDINGTIRFKMKNNNLYFIDTAK